MLASAPGTAGETQRRSLAHSFSPVRRAGVAIGIDARNSDQLSEEISGSHRFFCWRYQSMNFGIPSEILTFGW